MVSLPISASGPGSVIWHSRLWEPDLAYITLVSMWWSLMPAALPCIAYFPRIYLFLVFQASASKIPSRTCLSFPCSELAHVKSSPWVRLALCMAASFLKGRGLVFLFPEPWQGHCTLERFLDWMDVGSPYRGTYKRTYRILSEVDHRVLHSHKKY